MAETGQTNIERVFGETLNVSVGTAIALEALLTTDAAKGYSHLYMNIRTLYRNFHGSFTKEQLPPFKKYVAQFRAELETINSIVSESIPGRIQPLLYITTGQCLPHVMPWAKLKQMTTTKQKNYESLERSVMASLMSEVDEDFIQVYDALIKGHNTSSLIITHQPLDLLSHHSFRKLVLLESHTGALKTKNEWITKLTKNEAYRNMPFNILTIQVLGDRNNQFNSIGIKIINRLMELAEQNHWSTVTTLEKIKFDIVHKLKDKALASALLEMAMVKLK